MRYEHLKVLLDTEETMENLGFAAALLAKADVPAPILILLAAGWIERYDGPVPPLISPMVVVKKKPPLGEDGLPDLTAPPKYS